MRITKMGDQPEKDFIDARKAANEGCHLCPCCQRRVTQPFAYRNITNTHRIDLYRCLACGCEWESELYPFTIPKCPSITDYPINQVLTNLHIIALEACATGEAYFALSIEWDVLSTTIRGTAVLTFAPPNKLQLSHTSYSNVPAEYREIIGQAILAKLSTRITFK